MRLGQVMYIAKGNTRKVTVLTLDCNTSRRSSQNLINTISALGEGDNNNINNAVHGQPHRRRGSACLFDIEFVHIGRGECNKELEHPTRQMALADRRPVINNAGSGFHCGKKYQLRPAEKSTHQQTNQQIYLYRNIY